MTADARRIGIAAGATAAGNALLFLAVAWALAVFRGLYPGTAALAVVPASPDPVAIVVVPAAAEPSAVPQEERRHIQAPPGVPEQAPDRPAAFQSSRNMRAASESAPSAAGDPNRPSIAGIDRPFQDLADSEFQDGDIDAQSAGTPAAAAAPPSAAAAPPTIPDNPAPAARPPEPTAVAAEADNPAADDDSPPEPAFRDLAADSALPVEPIRRPDPPARPQPAAERATKPAAASQPAATTPGGTAYRPQTRKARSSGSISTRSAAASVDAEATPEGRYGRTIYNIIGRNWQRKMQELGGLVNTGLVEVDFEIDLQGRISSIRLANPGEANPVLQDCALSAVLNARLPPPPEELVRALSDRIAGGRFPQRMSFLSY